MSKHYPAHLIPKLELVDADGHFVWVFLHHDGEVAVSEVDPVHDESD